jgi:flagellar basal-body rod protein FlgC
MNITASNIANVSTTKVDEQTGEPYKRQRVIISSNAGSATFGTTLQRVSRELSTTHPYHLRQNQTGQMGSHNGPGVQVEEIVKDPTPPRRIYDPVHPDADTDGYVAMPDINIVVEMVDMISATRAYEANITAISAAKSMARQAIDI